MMLPVYQCVISLIVCLSVRRCPSEFMNVAMWEHCAFDSQIFGHVKVNYTNCIIFTNFV
jgi:hypothetical protein